MRTIFQKWLFLNIVIVFILTFFLALRIHTRQADQGAREMIELKIKDTIDNINVYQQTSDYLEEIIKSDAKTTLNSFAEILKYDPAILTDPGRLELLTYVFDVEDLCVSDENGILIATSDPAMIGYDMKSHPQSREFIPLIEGSGPEAGAEWEKLMKEASADENVDKTAVGEEHNIPILYQSPQPRGFDGKLFQFVGRGRKDKPGIILFGDLPDWYEKIRSVSSITNMASGFRIGTLGQIFITRSDKIVSIDNTNWINKNITDYGIPPKMFAGDSGEFHTSLRRDRLIDDRLHSDEDQKTKLLDVLCIYQKFRGYTIVGLIPNDEMYFSRNLMLRDVTIIYGLLFLVVFSVVSWLVDKIVIRGITEVNTSLAKITNGDLNERVEVRNNREFISLSDGINSTVDALKKAIAETAARIDKEIEFARAIQSATLPVLSPYPFADRTDFALFASMDTAKGVGGDLYDFLMIDDDHLAVVIADVSGKGIPASLFMMKAKAVIRGEFTDGSSTDVMMTNANNILSENNASAMFVTTFLGILELSTGKFTATNAGHNAPVLVRRGEKPVYLDISGGVILGAIEGIDYDKSELTLQPGDRIFLYTDGVTEALNTSGELFGEDRLLGVLGAKEAESLAPEPLLHYVSDQLHDYTKNAPQSDDITMMVLEYKEK